MNHFDMELTQRQAQEYKRATKKQKGEILRQYCRLTRVSRNLASKRFRKVVRGFRPAALKTTPKKKTGRKLKYTSIHKAIIHQVWELSGEICGERLHSVLSEYISELEKNGALKYYGKRYIEETKAVSERTLKRVIAKFPKEKRRKRYKGNASIYKAIPINAHFGRNADKPGYVEVDYVEHNGGNSKGGFANTGCYVDVHLGWAARSAALGKSLRSVGLIHDKVGKRIHHRIYEYHPDNAKPILRLLLERKLDKRKKHYTISRSRPYHKEDNGHVEQKNGDKVRKLVGYHRYDREEQVELLNQLYEVEDNLSNFFTPSQKLTEKIVDDKGRVISRKHDRAQTAFTRLMKSPRVSKKTKKKAASIREGLNLIGLRKRSDRLQKQLFAAVISRNV